MINRPFITYGINSNDADFVAKNIQFDEFSSKYDLFESDVYLGEIKLNVPGIHNVKNSLAAICCAVELEIDIEYIINGLNKYSGVRRRFERVYNSSDRNISIIDDYAHHPTEIRATIDAAKNLSKKRVIAIFQPHLYSRTRDFCSEFAKSLFPADIIVITKIFGAREQPIENIKSENIIDILNKIGHKNAIVIDDQEDIPVYLKKVIMNDDLIVISNNA